MLAACLVSSVGHLLFALATPERPAQTSRAKPRDIEFTLAVAAPAVQPTEPSFEPLPSTDSVEPLTPTMQRARDAQPAPLPSVPAPAEPATASEPSPKAPSVQAPQPRATGSIDLSPRAAAATLTAEIEKQLSSGSCSAAQQGEGACDGAPQAVASKPPDRGTGARMPGSAEFTLEPARGGGYTHRSLGFNALIEPNGDIHFDDKTRDLNDLVSNMLGEQAYTAQKRRFLAQTAELRDQLADAALVKNQLRGIAALAHQLQRILADAARSHVQKRVAIFALWDDCANDTLGAEAQRKIELFVRENLARGGALAYTTEELTALNLRRVSKRLFDPYDSSHRNDAGPQPG